LGLSSNLFRRINGGIVYFVAPGFFWKNSMVDIDGILVAAIRTMWPQVDGPESPPRCQIEVETARRVRIALEREGIIMALSRPTPEVWQSSGGSIPIEELNASNDV
jgi:hypothetical protein